ncbi:cilia- and flagella-associated protein 61-like isoform X2 [Haliotis rufescens]|uniref:cilia- and flagella-associated protein 61-like isoform X2 n=1 Tax=Haliotis rufescens TaxID=6454 RepID=UPI00201F6210|nr:cilia- and flagella-associated protein 61-like isoform X2 [Haliotis rufescens]
MSKVASPDGSDEVINARRTESIDAPHIVSLATKSTEALFGRVNIVNIIEKAILAVTLSNASEEILGHAAFFDFPNLPDVDEAEWEAWMSKFYYTSKCNALNTLFMHYFVSKNEYAHGCAEEIIRTAFNAVPDLHFLFLVVPHGVYPDAAVADVFKPLEKKEGVMAGPNNCVMFVCHRHDHVPVLHIRHARVEDHDDLTPIFNRHSDMLKMTYGDYFLAELIEAQNDNMQCLVAEVEGTAQGFMSISDDVNYDLLNNCFELGPFHGLRHPHPDDEVVPPKTPTPSPTPKKESVENGRTSQLSTSSFDSRRSIEIEHVGQFEEGIKEEFGTAGEGGTEKVGTAKTETEPKTAGSRQSSAKSAKGSVSGEVKVRPRLTDAQMNGSCSSLLSESSELSVAPEVLEQQQSAPPTQGTQRNVGSRDSVRGTPQAQLNAPPKHFIPTYKGSENAFSVQLFCIDERFEMRSFDFLAKAFSLFPTMDFCIITVPHLVPEFPLLQGFVRVTPRSSSTLPQELYVFHRSGLLKDFHVRVACSSDVRGVDMLVQTVDLHDNLLKDLKQFNMARRDESGTEIQAFVAESQDQIVGVAIVRREEDIEYIRSHYNIEDFIYYNHHRRQDHAHLHHFALNPIFNHLSKHFLKEVLRLGHKTCLYYPLYPPYTKKEIVDKHSLVGCLNNLVPVHARRQIVYPLTELESNAPSQRVLKHQEPYALNHINRKLTLEPKVTINARIVVVGASDVGISFLETLAYCPHLRFNNLTLISPHGIPGEMLPDALRDSFLSTSHCYSQEEYSKSALRTWVNVVYGKMTAIDRKKKLVVVNGNVVVPFDHLVISTGQQYQVPCPTDADIEAGETNADLENSPDRRHTGSVPKNLFLTNDAYDSSVALYRVENGLLKTEKKIVVYGNTLDAICCVQTLMSAGVEPSRISLVQPPLAYEVTCVNNPTVEKTITDNLAAAGVTVRTNCILARYNTTDDGSEVTSLDFTTKSHPLNVQCDALFPFFIKSVDFDSFKAINDACLVYDGKLVIDASFHTNDVAIRGAGTITKYQRRYHADQWTHANFNSKEVGIALAVEMLRLFDPTVEPQSTPGEEPLNLIPIYRNPKVHGGILPGGLHYLQVAKPSLPVPLDVHMAQSDYGRELITGEVGPDACYFRLHLNQYNTIETITCLSKQPVPASNLICLFGIHERYLNNMLSRYEEGLIKDFYSYFQQSWSMAIYHDRFPDFRDEIRELLITSPEEALEALEEKVRMVVDDEISMSKTQRRELLEAYAGTGAKRAVETRLLSFISYNYYHLPMYAKPGMV